MKSILGLLCLLTAMAAQGQSSPAEAVAAILDQFHQEASEGDWNAYFDLMSDDAVFLGTDVNERWTKEVFRSYAGNRSGWTYTPLQRNINFTPDGNTAWFDEVLDSASYGTSRGTGVLILTDAGWKISQYHLTFPIPNALSRQFTDQIKSWEAQQ